MSRSIQERLAALQRSVGSHPPAASEPDRSTGSTSASTQSGRSLADLGFTAVHTESGSYWVREMRYDVLTVHGQFRFADATLCSLNALARVGKCTVPAVGQMRFYDTETTGLGTGAGTIPFLHAVGQFEEDEFVVYQYFLDDYSGEPSLLQALLTHHFHDGDTVFSFNGKSFDWPMLRSRLAMYRLQEPPCAQIDLLVPARRLWKHQLTRVTLSCVEAAVLGLQRVDDLPGKEAPARYFAYIDDRDASRVDPVLDHNATDVCSLVVLTALLADLLEQRRDAQNAGEWVALGRLYDEWREYDLAERCFAAAVQSKDVTWKARWLRSLHHKRRGQWIEACAMWEEMVELHAWTIPPAVELAKYCEHRAHDYLQAQAWARVGLQRALDGLRHRVTGEGSMTPDPNGDEVVASLRKRLARIERKLNARQEP